jgi:single-strand selective monofunctional uracil DNA glycosylase
MNEHPLFALASELSKQLSALKFSAPVHTVYDPTQYAAAPTRTYFERFGGSPKEVLFLGMNPGPWGMAQTGVPFGEIAAVRDWMGICEPVNKPKTEHEKRPVEGFDCSRSEVSGRRLWGGFSQWWGEPEAFFKNHFVANYCPLVFMEAGGRNRTPDKLPKDERMPLEALCDAHLRAVVEELGVQTVIGVGRFAESVAKRALDEGFKIDTILHPSPASPIANRGWAEQAHRQLIKLGLLP